MATAEPPSLSVTDITIEKFLAWEKDDLAIITNHLCDDLALPGMVSQLTLLSDQKDGDPNLSLQDDTEDAMDGARHGQPQASAPSQQPGQGPSTPGCDILEHVNDRALLLMYAPTGPTKPTDLSLEEDVRARQLQYDSFCEIYPGIRDDSVHNPHRIERVDSSEDIRTKVMNFREEFERITKKVVIIINGHGSPGHLYVGENRDLVEIGKVIDVIKAPLPADNLQLPMQGIPDLDLPRAVEIVLAECYGHLQKHPWVEGRIEIIPLSCDNQPRTRFRIYLNTEAKRRGVRIIEKARNEQLNAYATEQAQLDHELKTRDNTQVATEIVADDGVTGND